MGVFLLTENIVQSIFIKDVLKIQHSHESIQHSIRKSIRNHQSYMEMKWSYELIFPTGEIRKMTANPDYNVSSCGLVQNIYGRWTSGTKEGGYMYFNKHRIHMRIAETFIGDQRSETKIYVNHIDGNKTNNNISNLEYVTPKENSEHAVITGLNSCTKAVHCINKDTYEIIRTYISINEASRHLVKSCNGISQCCKGLQKTSGGFMWKLVD